MPRLPQPGGDDGNWGQILNDFLGQTHNVDGTLKAGAVTSTAIAPNAVDATALGVTGGTDGQVLVKSTGASTGLAWATPTSSVVNDASSSTKGIVQLTGDLGGTAAAPTVPGLAAKADTASLSNYVLNSAVGAVNGVASLDGTGKVPSSQLPASGGAVTSVAGKTGVVTLVKADVGLANVDNTADISKPISTATQTALNAKADTATTYTMSATDTLLAGKAALNHTHTLDNLSDVTASGATNGQSLVYNSGVWGPADVGTGSTVVDATAGTKGVVQLAGDFSGTAALPVVVGLQGVPVSATAPSNGQVLTYNGSSAAWASGGGGGSTNVIHKSGTYTALAGDYILLDLSSGPITITAPAPANGATFSVKKVDASNNNVTVTPPSGNIDGYLVNFSFPVTDRGISQDFLSDGTNWYLV